MTTPVSEKNIPVTSIKRRARRVLTDNGKMKAPQIEGYYTRFINTNSRHYPTRLQDYKDAWYEPVTRGELFGKDCDSPNEIYTIDDPDEPMLVKLPADIHAEDVSKMHAKNELIQNARANHREDNQYGKVSISDT